MHLVFINYIISDSRDGRYNNLHYKLLLYLHKNGTNQNVTLIAAIYIYIHSVVKRSGTIIIKKKKNEKYTIFCSLSILAHLLQGRRGICTLFLLFQIPSRHAHTHIDVQYTCCVYNIYVYTFKLSCSVQRPAEYYVRRSVIKRFFFVRFG